MASTSGSPRPAAAAEAGRPDLADFDRDVRAWCWANVPAGWQAAQTGITDEEFVRFQQSWFQTLRAGGYAAPHLPAEWEGGFSLAQQAVIYRELATAGAPRLVLHFVSLHHAAATLLIAGSEEQKRRHLPAILDGEVWCQGFSEPNAGSDLAALGTRAVRDGDCYVVNGQKVWASLAMYADWCLLLARTDPSAPKRKGISYFLLDMTSAGVEVRPIRQATGEAHFAELFLTDVRVPVADLVGAEGDGWSIAQATLGAERGMTIVELAERLGMGYQWLKDLAGSAVLSTGGRAIEDPCVRERLAELGADVTGLRLLCARLVSDLEARGGAAPSASILKLMYSELLQRLTAFGVDIGGQNAHRVLARPMSAGWESGAWMLDHLGSWEWTIPGGASEIQRNIIGERVLGLPRDPGVA